MALQGVLWPSKGFLWTQKGPLLVISSGCLWLDMRLLWPKNRIYVYNKMYLWPTEGPWSVIQGLVT